MTELKIEGAAPCAPMTGEEMFAHRLALQITQAELGAMIGKRSVSISRYEMDKAPISGTVAASVRMLRAIITMKYEMDEMEKGMASARKLVMELGGG